jgi:hypothetical protein
VGAANIPSAAKAANQSSYFGAAEAAPFQNRWLFSTPKARYRWLLSTRKARFSNTAKAGQAIALAYLEAGRRLTSGFG